MEISFRESDHTYWLGAIRVPSVTEILRPLGADYRFVKDDVLQWTTDLGRAVHRPIELHLLDDLDHSSMEGDVSQYFDQFLKFQRDTGFAALQTEAVVSHALGYAGTLDCVGILNGNTVLIDWKTTAQISPTVALQTAAYAMALDSGRPPADHVSGRRYALRLTPTHYRLHSFPPQSYQYDVCVFKALLTTHQWCASNSKLQEQYNAE